MRKLWLPLLFTLLLIGTNHICAQTWDWATKPEGHSGVGGNENGVTGVAIDPLLNTYIVGMFNDSATFQGTTMVSQNELDSYIAKINSSGDLQWLQTIPGPSAQDYAIGVEVDPSGNAYMACIFTDSLDFSGTKVYPSGTSATAFAKYDSDGNVAWAKLVNTVSTGDEGGLAYSPTDHIYLGVGFTFQKYTLDGDTVWTRDIEFPTNNASIHDIAVDGAGEYVYITGSYSGSPNIGGIDLPAATGNFDLFLAKYDQNGNAVWVETAGQNSGPYVEDGQGIDVDQSGNVYVCGQYTGVAHFGADSIDAGASTWQLFVAKYDGDGDLDWVFGGTDDDFTSARAANVRVSGDGSEILVAGQFISPMNFGGIDFTMDVDNNRDALLLRMRASDGAILWSQQSGSSTAFITVHAMDLHKNSGTAVVVGRHWSQGAEFSPFVFGMPFGSSADGFIASTETGIATAVRERPGVMLPTSYSLQQNYPNPFNPVTIIPFDVATPDHVELSVIDVLGRTVTTLVDEDLSAGAYEVKWDGLGSSGEKVATGVYFYRITIGKYSETRKMLLLK